MMCATDLISFLETDFADRGAVIWNAMDAAGSAAEPPCVQIKHGEIDNAGAHSGQMNV
jgi:hypothetical protein